MPWWSGFCPVWIVARDGEQEGVEYAEGIRLARLGEDWREDRIGLGPTALPHLLRIEIEQRR